MQKDKLQYGKESFISAVKRFMEMKVLTKQLLYQLIDRIEVYETEGVGKNRTQRVVIFWKFVGYIELPECVPQKNYKADTRQGVAVEYHTGVLPAHRKRCENKRKMSIHNIKSVMNTRYGHKVDNGFDQNPHEHYIFEASAHWLNVEKAEISV